MTERGTASVSFSVFLVIAMLFRLLLILGVLAVFAYLVSLPYLWKSGSGVRSKSTLWLGYAPALVVGIAPVVMLAGVLLIRGPVFIYPAYFCILVGVVSGVIGPAIVPEFRRRMVFGLPLLLVWAYLSTVLVLAGGGMPVQLDAPINVFVS